MPKDKKMRIFCGTPSYMAPEIVTKKEYAGPPVDIWASGVLLWVMLCGSFPFKGPNDRELYRKITLGKFVMPEYVNLKVKDLFLKIF